MPDPNASQSRLTVAWRLGRVALHLVRGVATVLVVFPWLALPRRRAIKQAWSRRLLQLLAVRLEVRGVAPQPGSMIVANHISWLDVYAINAVQPAAFVAKSEVRGWPLIGWLAARSETIFLRRGSRGHARIINEEIARILDGGGNVAVFPEATTTDGSHLLHFHAALLQPAIAAGHAVQPVAVAYRDSDGKRSLVPAYVGETTLVQSLCAIAAAGRLTAEVWVGESLTADATHRRELAVAARGAIAEALGLDEGLQTDADVAEAGVAGRVSHAVT
jgi:1-acyl-sn-glycerol-3-phosphate acyltransferase